MVPLDCRAVDMELLCGAVGLGIEVGKCSKTAFGWVEGKVGGKDS